MASANVVAPTPRSVPTTAIVKASLGNALASARTQIISMIGLRLSGGRVSVATLSLTAGSAGSHPTSGSPSTSSAC